MAKKPATALLPDRNVPGIDRRPAPDGKVYEIPMSTIHPSDWNPRTVFPDDEIDQLAENIATIGLLTPLIVEPDPDEPGQYLLMDGERRYRALKRANAALAQCIVRRFDTTADRVMAMLTTSLQRADLTPIDEANAYQRLLDLDLTQNDIATRVGRSKSHISKRLALLKLPAAIRTLVETGDVNLDTAGRLAALPKTDQAKVLAAASGTAGTASEALTRELDALDQADTPKPPRVTVAPPPQKPTPPADQPERDRPDPTPPARLTTGMDTARLQHLGTVVLGESHPRYSPNSVILETVRVLRSTTASITIDLDAVDELLGGAEVRERLANSATPTDRSKLVAAYLLAGLEQTWHDGWLDDRACDALDRIYKDTGYKP